MKAMGKRKSIGRFLGAIPAIIIFLFALLWIFSAANHVRRDSGAEGCRQLELALRRAAVACYASEGIYPPTPEYLVRHYGVQIEDEYIVHYEVFASNLMPEITVLEKDGQ